MYAHRVGEEHEKQTKMGSIRREGKIMRGELDVKSL
jgi:hypothetical protein